MHTHTVRHDESSLALLVDADAETRLIHRKYLSQVCRVEEAENGPEALAKIFSHRPDLLITDTRLGGIDGLQLCELLRTDGETRSLPIVLMTGEASTDSVARAKAAGADAVLVKPCLPSTLTSEVKRLLAASRALRARLDQANQHAAQQVTKSNRHVRESLRINERRLAQTSTDRVAQPIPQRCPVCDRPLSFEESHVGGVLMQEEQWDYFECRGGCGTFQYRHRTGKLRRTS